MEGEHLRLASFWSSVPAAAIFALAAVAQSLDAPEWRLIGLVGLSGVGVFLLARATTRWGAWGGAVLLALPLVVLWRDLPGEPLVVGAAVAVSVTWALLLASSLRPGAQRSSDMPA